MNADRLREAARTLRDDVRESYDAPLADWLDYEAARMDASPFQFHLPHEFRCATRVADAILGGDGDD